MLTSQPEQCRGWELGAGKKESENEVGDECEGGGGGGGG